MSPRRQPRLLQLPDGRMVTREESFAAWLEASDARMELEFISGDLTGLPADPFTAERLRIAEANLITRFHTIPEVLAPANREMFDKFMRFCGQCFVTGLGFYWTSTPVGYDDGKPYIAVQRDDIDVQLNVGSLVTAAVKRQTGEEWAFVYRNAQEDIRNLQASTGPSTS